MMDKKYEQELFQRFQESFNLYCQDVGYQSHRKDLFLSTLSGQKPSFVPRSIEEILTILDQEERPSRMAQDAESSAQVHSAYAFFRSDSPSAGTGPTSSSGVSVPFKNKF